MDEEIDDFFRYFVWFYIVDTSIKVGYKYNNVDQAAKTERNIN